jgi:hypothetical protein
MVARHEMRGLNLYRTVAIALALAGCGERGPEGGGGPKPEMQAAIDGWVQENGAAVQAQVEHLRAIHAKAAAIPSPVAATKVDAPDLVFFSSSSSRDKQVAGANAEVLPLEQLAQPGTFQLVPVAPRVSSAFIHDPVSAMANRAFPSANGGYTHDPAIDLKVLGAHAAKLLGLKYIVLLRQTEYVPAEFSGKIFLSGLYRADALVFRVADETLVGTVTVGVKNSGQVMTKFSLKNGSNAKDALRDDLAGGIRPVTVANVLKAMK